jgi:hypothetical protein
MVKKNLHTKDEERVRLVKREQNSETIIEKDNIEETDYSEEECTCSCRKTWKCCKSGIEYVCLTLLSVITGVRKCISSCIGCFCYPIKERCCNCCDNVDRDLNPYKNPNWDPYDHL